MPNYVWCPRNSVDLHSSGAGRGTDWGEYRAIWSINYFTYRISSIRTTMLIKESKEGI